MVFHEDSLGIYLPGKREMWRARTFLPRCQSLLSSLTDNRNTYSNTAAVLQQVRLASERDEPDIQEGQQIEGFTVQQVSDVPEFQLRAIRLEHEDTGAQYLHLQRDDTNNVFSINFRTTPFDSSGVPHILEHTTLCGSKKYPCRDPFFKMLNRSLATFMNAMTAPDYTLYPFSTQNQKDYYNLMSVYLDAVFNPLLKETDFRQEGWRLEHENVDDRTSPIMLKGVVFNEMKGALSENQTLFYEHLVNKMLPSHTYGVISGGDPLHIPQLTYDQLKAFHARYYHPSNAKFYSYGNFPLRNHLKFINDSYLKNYGKVVERYSEQTKVPLEKRWESAKEEHVLGKEDSMASDPEKQATIALSYLCTDIRNIDETFALHVLSELLISGPNAEFYKSLVEPNVGSGYSLATGFEGQTRDTFFSVGLQGINPKDFNWVIETCNKTIDKVVKEGFEKDRIEAILHNIELTTKHQSTDFGMRFLKSISSLWNHDGDLIKALKVNDTVRIFKENLSRNPRFLQEKMEEYFKQNNHKLTLKMTPDKEYDKKRDKMENDILKTKLSSMTSEMKQKIFEDGIRLREEQNMKPNVDCLPTLKTSDLKKDVDNDNLRHVASAGVPVQFSLQPTNCLTYVKGIIDTSSLPSDIKPYLPLFTSVATKMGTKHHDYRQLDQLVQLKTGGLSLSHHLAEKKDDVNSFEDGIMFSSFALDSNVESMFSLWEEIFNDITLEDKARLETLMNSTATHLKNNLAYEGHIYAMSASAALVNPAARRSEEIAGLSYIRWLCDLVKQNKYEEILPKLDALAKNIFNKKFMRLAVNLSPVSEKVVKSNLDVFTDSVRGSFEKTFVNVSDSGMSDSNLKRGIQYESALPVSYASKSLPTVPYTHKDYAPLRILCRLMTMKFLLPTIREKGGAYGAGARINPSGVITYYSYRDPKPNETFGAFDNSSLWVERKDFTEQDVEEAKLGVFQGIDAPTPPGARGSRQFVYGITEEEFQRHRLSLMDVTQDDVLRVASTYLDPSREVCEGRVLLGPLNEEVSKRPGETWTVEKL